MKRTYYFPTVNGKPVNFSNNGSILYCGRYCPLRPVHEDRDRGIKMRNKKKITCSYCNGTGNAETGQTHYWVSCPHCHGIGNISVENKSKQTRKEGNE